MIGKDIKKLQSLINKLDELQSKKSDDKGNGNNVNNTINL